MFLVEHRGSKNPLLRYFVAAPLIWLMIVPIVIADIFIEIYHRIAFPIYGIPYVKRSEYIHIVDRAKLPYLNWMERLGCAYCGYVNGWLHYASVIAGRTESYFCAISHLETKGYKPSEHEKYFVQYGDEAALKKRYFLHELKYGPDTRRKKI
ncbi:MAG TPA: hypothetical protein VMR46_01325 [Candidatus Paceibacterota bacterium]|nr:hypothetical protein [Candidatus Paceibacterota bacterium]